jgi:phosphoribosylamine--glycine ligase
VKVCVVGSGGREHALAVALGRNAEVVVTPGNAGIPGSTNERPEDIDADLLVIGPETPLVEGLADYLRGAGRLVFGPGADGARLEGSKAWMKDLLRAAGVPTARYGAFTEVEPALAFLGDLPGPFVVKTDGLAAGKGVLVTTDLAEARGAVDEYLSGAAFGDAGRTLVIEEGLTGPELSILAVCDGQRAVPLAPAQDFKRVGDGDAGPNTGGMGAYSPVPVAGDDVVAMVMDDAVAPTLAALRAMGIDYRGVLYAGLMLTPAGPKMLEYNVRFGDPETQVVLPRLTSDLGELLAAAARGEISEAPTSDDGAAVTVVCASEGYPRDVRTGDAIEGLESARAVQGVSVFCAGVAAGADGGLVTAGGRVLAVTGQGPDLASARARAYDAVGHISWPGMHHRNDIASAAVAGTA